MSSNQLRQPGVRENLGGLDHIPGSSVSTGEGETDLTEAGRMAYAPRPGAPG